MVDEAAGKERQIKALVEVQGFDIGENTRRVLGHRGKHVWGVVYRSDAQAPLKEPPRKTARSAAELEDGSAHVEQRLVVFELTEVRQLAVQIDGAAVRRVHSRA
jgi:hypothetical protein